MKKRNPPHRTDEIGAPPAPSRARQGAVKDEVLTLTIEQVAPLFGKSVSSIRSDMSRRPESLPKWFKCPGTKRPLWLVKTVERYIEEQAARFGVAAAEAED